MSQPAPSGSGTSHSYPGLGLYLRHLPQHNDEIEFYPLGIHYNCVGSESHILYVREVAMMIVMDRLSDKPDFHRKVFDDAIAAKWVKEGIAMPVKPLWEEIVLEENNHSMPKMPKAILDKDCLEYCIKELRAKAKFFEKTGLIPTLDATASICKSDTLIDKPLHEALRAAFEKLQAEQESNPDWHPRTDNKVQDLVHPSLYPLVYGKTRGFADEVVGVDDAIDRWAGKGEIIPGFPDEGTGTVEYDYNYDVGGDLVEDEYWSDTYQWLPANIKFQPDGSVKFTSYINNLHPIKNREIYDTIEKLVEKAIPAWDNCIPIYHRDRQLLGGGRTKPRFSLPKNPDDDNEENWTPQLDEVETPMASGAPSEAEVKGDENSADGESLEEYSYDVKEPLSDDEYEGTRKEIKWKMIREPVQPKVPDFKAWEYGPVPGESLREKHEGLQIIVKMASIELTPEKPEFPAGGWHVEGQMNEHIVGTALYYLDSENITDSHLQFRMLTSSYIDDDYEVDQNNYSWLERVYGTQLSSGLGSPCLQNYGRVETKQGRLLAFPNVFHHRVSPFELKDKTKPGHRRFIALWLVDPMTRIISTANIPPQQQDWWMERTVNKLRSKESEKVTAPITQVLLEKNPSIHNPDLQAAAEGTSSGLPAEMKSVLSKEFGDAALMSLEEAKEHRLKLMDVRTAFEGKAQYKWLQPSYSFCEH